MSIGSEKVSCDFLGHKSRSIRNDSTDGTNLYLHGNRIAYHGTLDGREGIFLTLAGWDTPITRERLRGILCLMGHQSTTGAAILSIWTVKGQTYLGEPQAHHAYAFKLDPHTVVFVAHPIHARGIGAVRDALCFKTEGF